MLYFCIILPEHLSSSNSAHFLQKDNSGKIPGAQGQQTLISTLSISQPSTANKEDDKFRGTVIGWSDFHFFRFSKTGTLLYIGYIFMSSIPKNR